MSETELSWYAQGVQRILGCSGADAEMIKTIMADDILHTVALDWLTEGQFRKAAREAAALLEENRDMYEEHFATMRAMFVESKAAVTATA